MYTFDKSLFGYGRLAMSNLALVPAPERQAPQLLDELRQRAQVVYGRSEPGQRHVQWVRRFILFHGVRHPRELGLGEAGRFLEHLAQSEKDPLGCIEQARESLTFLYEQCLHLPLGELPFPEPPKLLDRVRRAMRLRHRSVRTEQCYNDWIVRFIRFHGLRHPNTMGGAEIELFLTDLAVNSHVSASTQNQALKKWQQAAAVGRMTKTTT